MDVVLVVVNDLFFSALGFFLGVWFYERYCSRKEARERNEE